MTNSHRSPGEGSVYQRSDGRWAAMVTQGDGRRKFYYAKNERDAEKRLRLALRTLDSGLPPSDERLTVAGYLDTWVAAVKDSVAPKTWISYAGIVNRYLKPELGRIKLAKLSPTHVEAMLASERLAGLSATSRAYCRNVLAVALQRAVKRGQLARNVAQLVDPPRRHKRELVPLSIAEVRTFLASVEEHPLHPLYVLLVTGGLRLGEALGLRWEDIDLEAGRLRLVAQLQRLDGSLQRVDLKTPSSRRSVVLAALAIAVLKEHRGRLAALPLPAAYVFTTTTGEPYDGRNVLRHFQAALRRAKLPKRRLHDLRHSTATLLLSQGAHPKVVADLLGHSSTRVTLDIYSHVVERMQREAVRHLDALLGPTANQPIETPRI